MCVVRIEKAPKLATACTTTVAEGMVVQTETPEIAQARKATLQLLLGNHPLDCPVCDAGGECELQDMDLQVRRSGQLLHRAKRTTARSRSGRRWSTSTARAASSAIAACACAAEGMDVFALGNPEPRQQLGDRTEHPRERKRPTAWPRSTVSSAACASTRAPLAR